MKTTPIVPIVTANNISCFLPDAVFAHEDVTTGLDANNNPIIVKTGALVFGKKLDILGIGNNEELLKTNAIDNTDTVGVAVNLKYVVYSVCGKVKRLDTENLPLSMFMPEQTTDIRKLYLNFNKRIIDAKEDGTPVDVTISVKGDVNIETAELNVYLTDESVIPTGEVKLLGYGIKAARVNYN